MSDRSRPQATSTSTSTATATSTSTSTATSAAERGTTLPDVMIGMALFSILTVAAVQSLLTIVDAGAAGDRLVDRRQDVERVADLLASDVGQASSVAGDLTPSAYPDELYLVVDETTAARVVWRRLGSGDLVREEEVGGVVSSRDTMLEATVGSLFSYFDATGGELDAVGDGPTAIAACTGRVRAAIATTRDGQVTSATVDAPLVLVPTTEPCP